MEFRILEVHSIEDPSHIIGTRYHCGTHGISRATVAFDANSLPPRRIVDRTRTAHPLEIQTKVSMTKFWAICRQTFPYKIRVARLIHPEGRFHKWRTAGWKNSQGWLMLEDRIKELKADSRFRDLVPNPARIARKDESSLRDNFEQIATGSAVVE